MAVTMTNGPSQEKFISGVDVHDPDYIRQLLRPPAIKEDVKLMQERSRVSLILRSPFFKRELEKIVASQMKDGCLNANVAALKQILDYLTPHTKLGSSTFTKNATMPVVPINDVRGPPPSTYRKGERLVRCKVASVYRLVDIFGWNRGINNHITAKVSREASEYLINPLGLLYHELTASSLVKVDLAGTILDPGSTRLGIDRQGWMLHAAVHEARPDVRCVVHLNTPATVAISCSKTGLLPISQEAMILGEVAVYDPSTIVSGPRETDDDPAQRKERHEAMERAAIGDLLRSKPSDCVVLVVRNNGMLVMGQSVEETWSTAFTAILACEAQLRVASISPDELVLPDENAQKAAHQVGRTPAAVQLRSGESVGSSGWRRGEMEFEAMMRRLDAAGYCTGHVYRLGQIRQSAGAGTTLQRPVGDVTDGAPAPAPMTPREAAAYVRKAASLGRGLRGIKDVEIPPATSSFATAYYEDEESRAAAAAEARAKTMSLSRTHWFNTPNAYSREEIEEVGTANPKKIAHWTEGTGESKRRTGGFAVSVDNPNQFAPQGVDPNEFLAQRKKVKDKYYKDSKNAGPKSKILEGIDIDEDEGVSAGASPKLMSPRGTLLRYDPANPPPIEPGHVVVVGAASKGIINRDQRYNAEIYQSIYSPNPFDRVTDDELERYRINVERKAKGLPSLEEEEAAARIEEARRAAEIARQAMEAAAQEVEAQKLRFHLTNSFRLERNSTIADMSSTLADLPTSILNSSATSACLTETDKLLNTRHSAFSSKVEIDNMGSSNSANPQLQNSSLDTLSSAPMLSVSANESSVTEKSIVRRNSAFPCWYWPRKNFRSAPLVHPGSEQKTDGEISSHMDGTGAVPFIALKRHKTITGVAVHCNDDICSPYEGLIVRSFSTAMEPTTSVSEAGDAGTAVDQHLARNHTLVLSRSVRFCDVASSGTSDCGDQPSPAAAEMHAGETSQVGQSYTSGAEASHDDTEKETKKEEEGTEKKKKRRFKLPSFARKSKPKSKK